MSKEENGFEEVHFTIEGDFLTNHFRNLVLEGEWSKSINHMQQSLIGMPVEIIMQVLSGEKKLVGINQMLLEDDLDSSEYRTEVLRLYGKRIYRNGKWFKPMAIINTISEDCEFAADRARIYNPDYDSYMFLNGNLITLEDSEVMNPPVWLEEQLRKDPLPEIFLKDVLVYGVTENTVKYSDSEYEMNKKGDF